MSDSFTIAMAGLGLAAVIVMPEQGPTAWLRERVLTRAGRGPFDCMLCLAPWAGLAAWGIDRIAPVGAMGALIAPGLVAGLMAIDRNRVTRVKRCVTCGGRNGAKEEGARGGQEGASQRP